MEQNSREWEKEKQLTISAVRSSSRGSDWARAHHAGCQARESQEIAGPRVVSSLQAVSDPMRFSSRATGSQAIYMPPPQHADFDFCSSQSSASFVPSLSFLAAWGHGPMIRKRE